MFVGVAGGESATATSLTPQHVQSGLLSFYASIKCDLVNCDDMDCGSLVVINLPL